MNQYDVKQWIILPLQAQLEWQALLLLASQQLFVIIAPIVRWRHLSLGLRPLQTGGHWGFSTRGDVE